MRKGIARGIAAGLVGIGISALVGAAPASATERGEPSCELERICMWEDTEFDGTRYINAAAQASDQCHEIDWWNGDNEISAVYNHSRSLRVTLYANDGCTGPTYVVAADLPISNLNSFGFDNEAESFKIHR
ncbi:peptidase inhibitor family I36 protein [Allokutzneria sp. NRRL B-24872]|uniref:peptidase inhibitor family I36 protein n=1 Tax=Allokutzneria sp. NRRL B-24872 TaxID=1137961 RepID=UPI000A38877A|nr:peptidase inhibitor family I36 protein [Allokutzneria sp. NRRL B-24872]